MKKRYKFKYRSKALNTFYVSFQNFMLGLIAVPVIVLVEFILDAVGIDAFDDYDIAIMWASVFAVFAFFQIIYWAGHKGITVTDDKLLINYCCIVPPIHTFKKDILIRGVESAEFCSEPVNQRIEEVEGGAYNEPYVLIKYGYGGRKEVRLPLQNAEDFIKTINDITKEQGE